MSYNIIWSLCKLIFVCINGSPWLHAVGWLPRYVVRTVGAGRLYQQQSTADSLIWLNRVFLNLSDCTMLGHTTLKIK